MIRRVAVAGVGLTAATSPNRQTRSKAELCQEAVARALGHAGCARADVDAIVVGNIDPFEAVNLSGRTIAPLLGLARHIPVYIVNTGGNTGGGAFNLAVSLVKGGAHERVICLGPPTFDGPVDFNSVVNKATAVAMETPLGLDALHSGAFIADAYLQTYGIDSDVLEACASHSRNNAADNPYAHIRVRLSSADAETMVSTPLRREMCCPVSSGATALLVTTAEIAKRLNNDVVRVAAYGSIGDTYLGGGRHSFNSFEVLAILADRLYREADIVDPGHEIDIREMFSPFAPILMVQLEDLQMCGRGEAAGLMRAGAMEANGALPSNLSGGPHSSNPGVAAQLAPVAYVTLQLMGQAAGKQVVGARRGVAHSMGSSWWQFHTMTILERTP
jgi:acetyl-CoA C-acetyltransferase